MDLSLHVNDKMKLYTKSFLSPHHEQLLHFLYQPIMGIQATNLYLTFWNFLAFQLDELLPHKEVLTFFNWNLKEFLNYRNQLEAIGLMNVYYNRLEGFYLYELNQPMTAKQFFLDSNLNVNLLYTVGEHLYSLIEDRFVVKGMDERYTNITRPFSEHFQLLQDVKGIDDKEFVTTTNQHFTYPIQYNFDFEMFSLYCRGSFIHDGMLTEEVKEAIYREAALYHFDAKQMANITLRCVYEDNINLSILHEETKTYYKHMKTTSTISLSDIKPTMTPGEFSHLINKKQLTQKEKSLKVYKTKTPIEFLQLLQNNDLVPNSYIEIVKFLFEDFMFPGEVINVLLEFVKKRNDGRLPVEYTKTIASSWAFNHVKTAEEAMEMVEKIQNKEDEYQKRGEVAPTYKKNGRIIEPPKWMKEQPTPTVTDQSEELEDIDALKQLLASFK